MKKYISLFLIALLIFSFTACGETDLNGNTSSDSSVSSENTEEASYDTLTIWKYIFDHGYHISTKKISNEWAQNLIEELLALPENGNVSEKISDQQITTTGFLDNKLPLPTPSFWLMTGDVIFRYETNGNLYRVETHLGEGKQLNLPKEIKDKIVAAIYYAPTNSYRGSFKDGVLQVDHVFPVEDCVEISINEITRISSKKCRVSFNLLSKTDCSDSLRTVSRQSSDNIGSWEYPKIELEANKTRTFEFEFYTWEKVPTYLEISIGGSFCSITVYS